MAKVGEKFYIDAVVDEQAGYTTTWSKWVNSIDDTKTQIYIPNGIQSGEIIEIPQKGYKNSKGERGNLIAQIKIVVPEKLTKEETEIFKKLKEISKFNPRRV